MHTVSEEGKYIKGLFSNSCLTGVISGLFASLGCYIFNMKAYKTFGEKAITYIGPIMEELLKTGLALAFGGSVFFSHMVFGVIEGLNDFFANQGASAYYSGILGVVSHGIFGIITCWGMNCFPNFIEGIVPALFLHILWNHLVMWIN
jgi:hypothetical protein